MNKDTSKFTSLTTAVSQAAGRRGLALALLEEEPSASQQVPLLLSLACTSAAAHSGTGAAGELLYTNALSADFGRFMICQ